MKDLYSFHANQKDLDRFYDKAIQTYKNIFARVGLGEKTYLTFASGGVFSKYSQEFQTVSDAGEDIIYVSKEKGIAVNKEVLNDEVLADLGLERGDLEEGKSVELGNIFKLGTSFSESLGLFYADEKGEKNFVVMGCYGIGPSRLMGTIVEALSDEKGIVWPESVTPFSIHLVSLNKNGEADALYSELIKAGVSVLYDDRDTSAGEKFADADLIGIPLRVVVSEKSLAAGGVEVKKRTEKESSIVPVSDVLKTMSH